MSNINVIGVIGALFITGGLFSHHVITTLNRKNIEIVTGVVQGIPTPQEWRWRTLMQVQVPVTVFLGAYQLVMGFAFLTIGDNVDDAAVTLLAQVCAWLYIFSAALSLITAPLSIAGIASLLRKGERD
jgi:hypothetical protein